MHSSFNINRMNKDFRLKITDYKATGIVLKKSAGDCGDPSRTDWEKKKKIHYGLVKNAGNSSVHKNLFATKVKNR